MDGGTWGDEAGISEDVSAKPKPSGAVVSAIEAMLYVSDFGRAHDFYVSKLGFVTEFTYGEPPFHGLVKRNGNLVLLAGPSA